MAASSKSGMPVGEGAGLGGPPADRSSPPRAAAGRADADTVPYSSPYFGVAMTGKELREGGAASMRLAESGSVVVQDPSHDEWFNRLSLGKDGLHYVNSPRGGAFFDGCITRMAIERVHDYMRSK
eukprot:15354496-Alexandrium_andersonii.AAC.1